MTETSKSQFKTLGVSGREQFVYIEREAELVGTAGAETYDKMRLQDPTGMSMYQVLSLPLRKANWWIEAASKADADQEVAQFVTDCFNDMSHTFSDLMANICLMFPQGWTQFWPVLKRRTEKTSSFPDGKVGFDKFEMVAHRAVMEWIFDETTLALIGPEVLREKGPNVVVPLDKSLHFRTSPEGDSPTGVSIYRPVVRTWKYRLRLEQAEGIGLSRRWKGFPIVWMPEGATTEADLGSKSDEYKARKMLEGIHDDRMVGAYLQQDVWGLDFGGPPGTIDATMGETIIRKDAEMARAILAHFIMLGLRAVGTQALAETLLDLFITSSEAFLTVIADEINSAAIGMLLDWNQFPAMTGAPKIRFASPRALDLRNVGAFINLIARAGTFTASLDSENFLRSLIPNMPQLEEGEFLESTESDSDDDDKKSEPGRSEPGNTTNIQEPTQVGTATQRGARTYQDDSGSSLSGYHQMADEHSAVQVEYLEQWTQGLVGDLGGELTEQELRDKMSAAILVGLAAFHARGAADLNEAFFAGLGRNYANPYELVSLAEEIRQYDAYIGYEADGELTLINPMGKLTLWGDISQHLEAESANVYALLQEGDVEAAAAAIILAVRAATRSYSRGGLYGGNVWRAIWAGAAFAISRDERVRWDVDPFAQHCGQCPTFQGEYPDWGTMMAYTGGILPGTGTDCDGNCRCTVRVNRLGMWIVP